jgi:hypothetical protein
MVDFEFEGSFESTSQFITSSIAYNPRNSDLSAATFDTATILIDTSNVSNTANVTFYLSPNGGSTWELATLNSALTFATTNGTDLRLKIEGASGETVTLGSYPVRIKYTYS